MALSIPFTPSPQVIRWRKERAARVKRLLRFRFSDLWRAKARRMSFISDDDEGRTMLMVCCAFGRRRGRARWSAIRG
jgi:hypothetical protein